MPLNTAHHLFDESIDTLETDPKDYEKWEKLNDIRTRIDGSGNAVPKFKTGYGEDS